MTSPPPVASERSPFLDWGVASSAMIGEATSGDVHLVRGRPDGALLAVVDGVGHGPEAGSAAMRAAETIARHSQESIIALVKTCHKALLGTRGAAMSLASFNVNDETMMWLSVGNVEGVLLRADAARFGNPRTVPAREAIVMRGGVVGYELPVIRAAVTTVASGDLLIFATDGIDATFTDHLDVTRPPQRLADHILAEHGKGTDDALVLVARYLGRRT